jgi:chromosome segregation ATPase
MLLKQLEIMNCRKIRQAVIEFHGPGVQVIEGANTSGKSTIAQSIALTMNGPKDYTPGMISKGEEKAEIIALTDDGLKIRTVIEDGVKQTAQKYDTVLRRFVNVSGGVRAFLNSICSGLEMPWALRDMTDAKIIELLKNRSGIDAKISAIDAELKEKTALRTEVGRDKTRMGELVEMPEVKHPDPIDTIKAEREKTRAYQVEYSKAMNIAVNSIRNAVSNACTVEDIEKISPLAIQSAKDAKAKLVAYKPYTEADIQKLDDQIAQWFNLEQKAMDYDEYHKNKVELDRLTTEYEKLTAEIEAIRENRKAVLQNMRLGVKGLEIGEDNLLYHNGMLRGITESQNSCNWSTAESVQVFFGLGARFAGDLKVLVVDNAESLDKYTTDTITGWAENAGFLVILLRVAEVPETLEDGIIYIKEGEIFAKETATEEKS